MKTFMHSMLVGIGIVLLTQTATADITKGKKIYMKRLKTACGYTGDKFARKHTQDEWEKIYESGKLKEEALRLCPGARLKDKYIKHLFDFVYEYASDSGKTPSC